MLEDKLLIWKFKGGSSDALRRIFLKYRENLLKLAVTLLGDVHTAEDVVHDVFVNLAQSAHRLRVHGNLKSFLATCVANRARNHWRDSQRHESIGLNDAETLPADGFRPEKWLELSEQMELLREAMSQLPYEQCEVITLYMQGDMTFRQIAEMQDVSINTVQGRYRYGIDKLRKLAGWSTEQ